MQARREGCFCYLPVSTACARFTGNDSASTVNKLQTPLGYWRDGICPHLAELSFAWIRLHSPLPPCSLPPFFGLLPALLFTLFLGLFFGRYPFTLYSCLAFSPCCLAFPPADAAYMPPYRFTRSV
eukprot:4006112-Pleurochrysis_carterae.AAC.2